MKIKKIISQSIALSLIFNTFMLNISLADSEYYEYIEGKLLSIDDTFSGSIKEMEVFGETIQDPNNLSDIQSVGDLYVDEKGNPILDKNGNKQYIIKLTSTNKNLFNNKDIIQGVYNYGTVGGTPVFRESDVRLTLAPENSIPIRPNTVITCKSDKFNFGVAELNNGVSLGDTGWQQKSVTFTTKPETTHIAFNLSKGDTPAGTEKITVDDLLPGDIMLYYGDEAVDLVEHLSSEIKIILPHQLQKAGDVSDKLYYDKSNNSFIVEKNIEDLILTGDEAWYGVNYNGEKTYQFGVNEGFDFTHNSVVLSDKFLQFPDKLLNRDKETISIRNNSNGIPTLYIRLEIDKLIGTKLDGFKEWLRNNHTLVKYKLSSPKISRLYFDDKMLSFYDEQTNLFVNSPNSIQPDIRVMIDKLPNLAIDAINEALSSQTIESISYARSLINQMEESSLKDMLQDKLNSLFNSSILEIDKKTISANADVYIKYKNTLSLSLNTNSIIFDDFTGVEDMEKLSAVSLTIGSSLPYEVKASLEAPIQNNDNTTTLDSNILSVKESSSDIYKTFSNISDSLLILNGNANESNLHNIDFKLSGGLLSKADAYKTVVKFTVNQH